MAKKTARAKGSRTIRQNRPNFRKEVIGYKHQKEFYRRAIKIKGKKYQRVK